MKRLLGLTVCLFLVLSPALNARKSSTGDFKRFFKVVKTYSADFDQVLLDEALTPIQESSGQLWIKRPGKFHWHYTSPYEQYIIGDGKRVWVYDVELKQVTSRQMDGALGKTPAVLLAGLGKVQKHFHISSLGRQGNLDWVQLKPKKYDGGYETIRVGFQNGRLRGLEMVDGFGQTTRVTLKNTRENKKISDKKFKFTPPAGVDVVEQ